MNMKIDLPKLELGLFPTPLAKLERLSTMFNCNIFIKRDDLCGVGVGGNKVRKLEYILADAINKGCDTIITMGGAQSNHALLTAMCSRKLGLEPILFLKKRGVTSNDGNLLLSNIIDAKINFIDTDHSSEVQKEALKLAEDLEKQGRKPYFIPIGGSIPLGTVGYISGALELFSQAEEEEKDIDHIICASGSGGTQGGLVAGTKLISKNTKVTGIMVSPEENFENTIMDLGNEAIKLINAEERIKLEDVILKDYIGAGYAIPSKEGIEAIKLLAKKEGIILDPVYTGKAFAGMLDLIRKGYIKENENVVFIHTGGIPGLFAVKLNG